MRGGGKLTANWMGVVKDIFSRMLRGLRQNKTKNHFTATPRVPLGRRLMKDWLPKVS